MKYNVLIIDDSILVRQVLYDIINSTPDFQVSGMASNPFEAHSLIKKQKPDVITLDIEMPKMNGLVFLDKLMRGLPIPVLMISSLTTHNAEASLEALNLGAIDYVPKPSSVSESSLETLSETIVEKLRLAVKVSPQTLNRRKKIYSSSAGNVVLDIKDKKQLDIIASRFRRNENPVIVIGSSTGGTVAIESLLKKLNNKNMPPIVIVQHIPPVFSYSFAKRLNSIFGFNIFEAVDSAKIFNGDVVIAQGGKHLLLKQETNSYSLIVKDGPKVNRHKPSVDVLFRSVAHTSSHNAIGIILTGMGHDGTRGMLEMKDNGAITFAQQPRECTVAGMPQSAINAGAVDFVFSLNEIAEALNLIFKEY